ncbi:hypothetical protein BN2475_50046 [Paraburkholderia ribeironis]|uniref:Uncharacterized protein n=1 Tax=Paraburkholderia ribeironis TaxID=1247936 RepID=A0A1N7RK34_9BURK|nr:hypothetical protein BN2475_50046 [Paraburkholderia ribeironis]
MDFYTQIASIQLDSVYIPIMQMVRQHSYHPEFTTDRMGNGPIPIVTIPTVRVWDHSTMRMIETKINAGSAIGIMDSHLPATRRIQYPDIGRSTRWKSNFASRITDP